MWVSLENEMHLTRRGCSWFPLLFPVACNNVIATYFWEHFAWSNESASGSALTWSEFFWPFIKNVAQWPWIPRENEKTQWPRQSLSWLFRYRNSIMNYRVRVGEVVSCPGGQGVRLSSVDARQTVGFIPPMCHSCPQMIKEKSAFFFFFSSSMRSLKCFLPCYNSSL